MLKVVKYLQSVEYGDSSKLAKGYFDLYIDDRDYGKETAERITEEGRNALHEAADKLNEIAGLTKSAAEKMEDLNRSVEKANKIGAKYNF
jgi:hypothetical protein